MGPHKVALVGWDAADWKVIRPLIDAGKMPNVRRLIENGATGAIATLHPPLSPMLWTSIATGMRPFQHGIHGFTEPTADGRSVRPVTNLSRKTKAIWNILNQNDLRSIVIGWWPSFPAEPIHGVMVSDHFHRATGPIGAGWPLAPHAVHPPELAKTLADLRIHPDQLTPEMIEPFVPLAREIDQDKDQRLAMLLRTLAECMSIHAVAMWLVEHQSWDFFAVYFDAIDHFCHAFMRYHPPRQSWIGERDFELYHNVVATAYQLQDGMLGELLAKMDAATNVILMSDHGFHPDHLRPRSIPNIPAGPAIEHRDLGILAMSGPRIQRGGFVHGASLLDITPTILTLFGLPVGEDMDGKVLLQAFAETPRVEFIPSWERVPGADGRHPPHTRLDPIAARESLEQMIALGYIERPDEDREKAVIRTLRELRFNLGESYQDDGRHAEAREIFRELHHGDPADSRYAVRLFVSCQALGLHQEMRGIIDAFGDGATPLLDLLRAQLWIAEHRDADAAAALERVMRSDLLRPGMFLEIADLYRRLGRWREAGQVYEKALALDPDNARAHLGLCRMALRRRKFAAAAHAALDAIERTYHDPEAHFLLGVALARLKEYTRAADAFRAAIGVNPNFPQAHVRLAGLLEQHLGDSECAREHRRLARQIRSGKRPPRSAETVVEISRAVPAQHGMATMPPLDQCVIVVTGLPRSGTSMLMQMLAAGGVPILSDGLRAADEDNPRGYFEFEPVKNLLNHSNWLLEAKGKAVKIVAPLLTALPGGLPCRVILCERDLKEVLDSQERMMRRRNHTTPMTPERRTMLKNEYTRTLARIEAILLRRPDTQLLMVDHAAAIADPLGIAQKLAQFLGKGLNVQRMAAAVDPSLRRNFARGGGLGP